ncbi:MAG: non-heme iron oxygenase ferredoxin subunit [Armatimonadetes bacterium]|nr:non-heme iron oxygenase ferredoxin subunit [Armatimonadota bacterium]
MRVTLQPARGGSMPLIKVAKVSDVPEGAGKAVDVGGVTVALFHRPDGWFAIEGICTHKGGPLAEGDVEGVTVTCPWHGGQFDIRNGNLIAPPPQRPVRAFRVVVDGEDVSLDVS